MKGIIAKLDEAERLLLEVKESLDLERLQGAPYQRRQRSEALRPDGR